MLQLNFDPFPILQTGRVVLREILPEDAAELYRLRNDAKVRRYVDIPEPASVEEMEAFIQKLRKGVKNNEALFWVISTTENNAFAGTICLWNISKEEHTAEVGYMLHPDYHGKGLMSEALAQVLSLGFNALEFDAIFAYTHKDNAASARLLERKGFERNMELEALIDRNEEPHIIAYKLGKPR